MAKVNHGICDRCEFEIICEDNLTCEFHKHLTHHYDPLDCVRLLKNRLDDSNEFFNYKKNR